MRSKDEALAQPMAGDRWKLDGKVREVHKVVGGTVFAGNPGVIGGSLWSIEAFSVQVENAEYLGGAE
jgi:hypothetical protein